jgi:hypothetical protein
VIIPIEEGKVVATTALLTLGTNTMRALIVNGEPVVSVLPDGVYVNPRYASALTVTPAGGAIYVTGSFEVNSVSIDIGADGIFIQHVGRITDQAVNAIRIKVNDRAEVEATAE